MRQRYCYNGDVVGYSTGATGAVAVLSTSDGEIVRIGTLPGGTSSRAVAINSGRQVVGWSRSAAGRLAFLWSARDGMRDLGTLPGDRESDALDINDSGHVVGPHWSKPHLRVSLDPLYRDRQGFKLWQEAITAARSASTIKEISSGCPRVPLARAATWSSTGAVRDLQLLSRPASIRYDPVGSAGDQHTQARSSPSAVAVNMRMTRTTPIISIMYSWLSVDTQDARRRLFVHRLR